MYIETESTPNPQSLKFLPGRPIMVSGSREFTDADEAQVSPLASAIFTLGDVTSVFYGSDFLSVTLGEGAAWDLPIKGEVVTMILEHFAGDAPLFLPPRAGFTVPAEGGADMDQAAGASGAQDAAAPGFASALPLVVEESAADAAIIEQINDLLEARVQPAVASDGGNIAYRGYADGVVYLTMQGACSGCPSSTQTLKYGIENLLRHYVPEVTEVREA